MRRRFKVMDVVWKSKYGHHFNDLILSWIKLIVEKFKMQWKLKSGISSNADGKLSL